MHYIIKNNTDLTALDVCTIFLGHEEGMKCDGNVTAKFFDWTINLKSSKPAVKDLPYLSEDTKTVEILQLTDIHLDLDYVVGKNTDCGKPMCCQAVEENGTDPESSAGPHGDYKCDMPLSSLNELFEYSANLEGYVSHFIK